MISHGRVETAIYFLIWSSGVTISLYQLFLAGNSELTVGRNFLIILVFIDFNHKEHHLYHYDDFSPGWFDRFQDTSDFEWACWTKLTIRLIPWLFVNTIGGETIRSLKKSDVLPIWYFMISFGAVSNILGAPSALLLTGIIVVFHGCVILKQPFWVWVLGFLWRRYVPSEVLAKSEEEVYLIEVKFIFKSCL